MSRALDRALQAVGGVAVVAITFLVPGPSTAVGAQVHDWTSGGPASPSARCPGSAARPTRRPDRNDPAAHRPITASLSAAAGNRRKL